MPDREHDKRKFAIDLGALVMCAIADGLDPDDALAVLKAKVMEEMRIERSRKALERTYG